ncbi:MAG TPA: Cof-type HAD-IIB family hydrolase [Bacillota bacterium]|nr:Cof-type HAD-IIB family hydrolase [Bacillota bacterium]
MGEKIVFLDIDGTLVDERKVIPPSTKEAIQRLQQSGVHVALATGRPPFMYEHIRDELNIDTYVSFSGQHAVVNGETIYKQPVDAKSIITLHEQAIEREFPMVFMSDTLMRSTVSDHPYVKQALDRLKFPYPHVDTNFPLEHTVYQALLFYEVGKSDLKKEQFALHFLRWHKYAIDILPEGGSKAIGVNKVMEALNLDHANSYAIGDGMNDLEMLQEVGTGIAMGNSVEPLKEVANYVTNSVNNDGVMQALKKFSLI